MIEDGLILKGDRIIIPEALRSQILDALHTGHQSKSKCLLLVRESVFWPDITNDIKQLVKDCDICNKPEQPKLPLMQPDSSTRPWEKLGTDICEFKGLKYLMIVDDYSRFPVIRLLSDISPIREPRTYIVDTINGKVYYRTKEHLKPRSNNMPKEVNEHFELPIQPFTPIPSTPTDIPSVSSAKISTPVTVETPVSQPKAATPVKAMSPVKPSFVKQTDSYQPQSFTTRSGRTTQVPAKFKD